MVEALIEFKTLETTAEDVKIMVDLIRFYTLIQDFIKEGLKTGGGGKKKGDEEPSQSSSDAGCTSTVSGAGGGGSGGGVKTSTSPSVSANKTSR